MADLRLHLKLETAYAQCESFLTSGVRKDQKLIGRCTSLRRDGERFDIHYHATDIVFVYRDRVTLDSGGWQTLTTKQRFNELMSGFRFLV